MRLITDEAGVTHELVDCEILRDFAMLRKGEVLTQTRDHAEKNLVPDGWVRILGDES